MLRLLLLAAVAVAVVWKFGGLGAEAASPTAPAVGRARSAPPVGASDLAGTEAAAAPVEAAATPAAAEARIAPLLTALESGHTSPAFAALIKASGKERERLAVTLLDLIAAADPATAVALLGKNNAFLHSDEGRRAGRAVLAKLDQLDEASQVKRLSQLLEACMRGPIRPADTAARAFVDEAYASHRRVLLRTVLNPADLARARTYRVKPGDALDRIARRYRKSGYKLEGATIAAFNRISDPRQLRAGQVLKIPVDPVRTVVEKKSFLQAVYVGDVIFRLYWIGHGRDDRTPEATFTVAAKQERPDWYAPDGSVIPYGHPNNPLGDYFVKLGHPSYTGFGCHGTPDSDSIGRTASAGCIRMQDGDIADFFRIVPRGTEVEIRATSW